MVPAAVFRFLGGGAHAFHFAWLKCLTYTTRASTCTHTHMHTHTRTHAHTHACQVLGLPAPQAATDRGASARSRAGRRAGAQGQGSSALGWHGLAADCMDFRFPVPAAPGLPLRPQRMRSSRSIHLASSRRRGCSR